MDHLPTAPLEDQITTMEEPKETYIKRDISWLYFNHRVLQEAKDKRNPLYERIKFLAIYSSNLDEFFRVRVASLRSFRELKKETRREMDIRPKKELKQIRKIVQEQQSEFGRIFRREILPQLKSHGIHLINETEYTPVQQDFARTYFGENLRRRLHPVLIDPEGQPPFLKNKGLYFVIQFEEEAQLALVDIPSDELPRFLALPSGDQEHYLTFLDDMVRFNLEQLFAKPIAGVYAIKLSRDAEVYIDDEFEGDLLEKIKQGLKDRNVGLPTRFLYDSSMPKELLKQLKQLFSLKKPDLIPGARYHNFNDFLSFPDPTHTPGLHFRHMPALPHPVLEKAASITAVIRQEDQLLHFPYQRYDYVPKWIWEASEDPAVRSIRITLYRVASDSNVVKALLHALEKGKEVTVFIEAKARFDESSNIYWGERLEQAGAKVLYSYPGIKVHTKLLLITREEEGALRHYAYLGTGNFNEKTARIYCDHAVLTADPRLADEVERIFGLLERKVIIPRCKHLLVSPFTLRSRFEELIDAETVQAQKGQEAYMILKLNNLEDPAMVEKLYKASQAGVHIRLIVRGICSLVPGVEGLSENIEIISILDRFLEHARVYIFCNGGQELMYIASADWMTRNLDRRVEVAAPIYDERIFSELRDIINIQLRDNVKARYIEASHGNPYRQAGEKEEPTRAQYEAYHYLQGKLRESEESPAPSLKKERR
jgi:polyphosphate kinase